MRCDNDRGFTIIEIALVMVIVGFLVGFGASLIKPLTDRSKRQQTRDTILAAVESVIGYAAANNQRLADNTLFPQVAKSQNDAWANPVAYVYDANLDVNNLNSDICGKKTTSITLRRCDDAGCTSFTDVQNVAFIVLSGGINFNNQTIGGQGIAVATTVQSYGLDVVVDNYNGDLGGARPETYDDLLEWVTLAELRTRLDCRGPPLFVLNNELPPGDTGSAYSATLYAEGGVPFTAGGGDYKWCLQTATGASPSNLTVNANVDTNCAGLAENSAVWIQADTVTFSGTPSTAGSFYLTAFVRDDNNSGNDTACSASSNLDNCMQKSFVITISP